jgi:monoamine oxidase
MAPKISESLDQLAVASFFWATYPYTLGSYASASVGQYTTLLDVTAEPALDGRVQFAGEHTSVDWLGYMNGGVARRPCRRCAHKATGTQETKKEMSAERPCFWPARSTPETRSSHAARSQFTGSCNCFPVAQNRVL